MIVWGGRSEIDSVVYDDGFRYDPANDAWTPIAREGAPAARWAHSVVWTGSEMIVWAGHPASTLSVREVVTTQPPTAGHQRR